MPSVPHFAREEYRKSLVRDILRILKKNDANFGLHHIMRPKSNDFVFWHGYLTNRECWDWVHMADSRVILFLKTFETRHLRNVAHKKQGIASELRPFIHEYLYDNADVILDNDEYVRVFVYRNIR